jgi:electron transport complex protein RnfD
MRFEPAFAPHYRPSASVTRVMGDVLIGLVPAAAAWTWYFGPGLLVNVIVATAVGVACEAAMVRLRGRPPARELADLSVVVTAVLFAFALPPLTPWWITATGMIFAVVFAKHLYGGLGFNPFNPAMVGYVVVLVSFPADLTHWLPPAGFDMAETRPGLAATVVYALTGGLPDGLTWDMIGGATPLDDLKTQVALARTVSEIRADPLYGDMGAHGWEWINNFVILGGAWLLYRRTIRWQIPVGVLAGILVPATLFYLFDAGHYAPPTFHAFSGATMLCAFFIATDPVSAATSERGRLVYGFGIGLLTWIIRTWGGYPDGVAFAVLLMNMAVPAIDSFTAPRVYGR